MNIPFLLFNEANGSYAYRLARMLEAGDLKPGSADITARDLDEFIAEADKFEAGESNFMDEHYEEYEVHGVIDRAGDAWGLFYMNGCLWLVPSDWTTNNAGDLCHDDCEDCADFNACSLVEDAEFECIAQCVKGGDR